MVLVTTFFHRNFQGKHKVVFFQTSFGSKMIHSVITKAMRGQKETLHHKLTEPACQDLQAAKQVHRDKHAKTTVLEKQWAHKANRWPRCGCMKLDFKINNPNMKPKHVLPSFAYILISLSQSVKAGLSLSFISCNEEVPLLKWLSDKTPNLTCQKGSVSYLFTGPCLIS